jgi:hypothetical protein
MTGDHYDGLTSEWSTGVIHCSEVCTCAARVSSSPLFVLFWCCACVRTQRDKILTTTHKKKNQRYINTLLGTHDHSQKQKQKHTQIHIHTQLHAHDDKPKTKTTHTHTHTHSRDMTDHGPPFDTSDGRGAPVRKGPALRSGVCTAAAAAAATTTTTTGRCFCLLLFVLNDIYI